MRIAHALLLVPLLVPTACGQAAASTVDSNDDFDCATTFSFFHELAKAQSSPDRQQQALFIANQWYALKWNDQHPGESAEQKNGRAAAIVSAMIKNPLDYKEVLKACSERAAADPHFINFATLMRERFPNDR